MQFRILHVTRAVAIVAVVGILGAVFLQQGSLLIRQAGGGVPLAHALPLAQDNSDSSSDNGDDTPPPPPPPARLQPPPPPPPPPPLPTGEVSACVAAGQEIVLALPGGNVRVKVFGQSFQITLRAVDPLAAPATPGQRVDDLVWEMIASTCDGIPLGELPEEVNIGVDYLPEAAAGLNPANFLIAVWDGVQWVPSPKQAGDPANSFVSATETRLGTYVVYQS